MLAQVAAGFFVANIVEHVAHEQVLHNLAKRKTTLGRFFRYHLQHHAVSKKNDFVDDSYRQPWWSEARLKEIIGVTVLVVGPGLLIAHVPAFTATVVVYAGLYLWAHRRSHLNTAWGKKWLNFHWRHHMVNPNTNFCVLFPLADVLFGTYA